SVKPAYRRPAAPFTTSTLQQEASRKLGFSVSRTMSVAQRLYEAGHITYMRTDSTTLSQVALQNIGDVIEKNFGVNYHKLRQYKNKNSNAQEAHEAIRPTYADRQHAGESREEQRLYELIWKRTTASQMADAQLEKTTIDIDISTQNQYHLVAEGQVLKFDGFLKVYLESTDEEDNNNDDDVILPPLTKGQALDLKNMTATERFTRPQPHYTEASLVKKLEELGIGRPSTYAPTIAKIMDPRRGYVAKDTREGKDRSYAVMTLDGADKKITETSQTEKVGAERNKLFASDMGRLVTDFLSEHFDDIMTYSFTADIEDKLDAIAHGKKKWINMIDGVYKPFHERVEHTLKEADRANIERILGKHPESGFSILVRMGKYGPMAQIGTPEELGEELKPQYSSLKKDQSLETITLEECLELFKLPKHLGTYENQEVVVNSGRFGAYIKFEKSNISVPRDEDPTQLTLNRAIELIKEKQKADAPIGYYAEKPITKGSGRFGPFVKWDNLYVSISKKSGFELETITEAQAIEIIKVKQEKEANRYIHNWEDWKISVENGRWGPFIKMVVGRKKENYKLLNKDGKRMTSEEAKELTFDQVKAIITDQGGVIKEPKKPKAKKAKTTTKKTTKAKAKTTKKTTK
ncbi:MAG: DNA topoisomerase, partial [Saprospiraceae bacterium]|nr:DNA topoisomerase [Saprospiraceae bacterium]